MTARRNPVAHLGGWGWHEATAQPRSQLDRCLATSLASLEAQEIVRLYGRRFTIEETFRDTKDINFGMGLRATHVRRADRRDRLLLLAALAHSLLSLLGVASERSGMDRGLKTNTVKRRTHSLFRQGVIWYEMLDIMSDERLERLLSAFDDVLREHQALSHIFAMLGPTFLAED